MLWVVIRSALHRENTPIHIYRKYHLKKTKKNQVKKKTDIFHIYAQNIEAVLTSTHNLCFLAEISKIMYTPVNSSFTI